MRQLLVVLHRWIGIASASVLAVLAVTGSILAFLPRYDAWLHPSLHRVTPQAPRVAAHALLDSAQARLGASVTEIVVAGPTEPWVLSAENGRAIADQYTGAILGIRTQPTTMDRVVNAAYRLHTRLGGWTLGRFGAGRLLVDGATIGALSLVLSGLVLWWKKKRFAFRRGKPWRAINWDLHSAVGLWAFAALLILATSGLFIAVPQLLFDITRSTPAPFSPTPLSDALDADGTVRCPAGGSANPMIDDVLAAAERAAPDLTTVAVELPAGKRAPYRVTRRPSGGLSDLSTTVMIDRYCGTVAAVDRSRATSRGFRIYSWNLALHDGTAWNDAGRVVLSVSSLMLGVLSFTGILMWVARTRPFARRSRVPSVPPSPIRSLS
jgi:uncharacterized iron-regulated membrane protein